MSLFTKTVTDEKKLDDMRLVHRLEKGKLKKEVADKERNISKLESKVELLESQKKDVETKVAYYQTLEIDQAKVEADKRVAKIEREDLTEDRKLYEHRLARLEKRAKRLEEEENDEFKKGYSDGLADGLRKAHDITREDRKYLTMIAMSTNQSEAIKTSQKAIESGFKDDSADA